MKCRFIDTGFNDAFTNMAIDEAILQNCQIPTLRVYSWNPKAVSIGYNQNLHKEINIDYCKKGNMDIVRRITGGKAVFHDQEITYSFIVPENTNLLPIDVNESYKIIAKALVIALKKININAGMIKVPEKITTPICFNSSNWCELLVNNKKISGSAQRRMNGKVLQHGSLLIDFNYDKNSSIFKSNNDYDNIENLKQRITSIKNEFNRYNKIINENIFDELKESIKLGFKENFDFEMVDDSLREEETILIEKLKREKYSTEEWNFRILKIN
jgi:lipoyl(octanoyl) transferase